ncbi:nitrate reductase molybdenum cofactor assembly chaperone [Streptomyces sp. NBC_00083]|uniref:nitrate reductase molybdenum cofactor assembly chaperone n=1 Tax=Streptomyces sp. NBC_00083 TaxID=2975647 RepID=UPI00224EF4B3|nr:nitrate reductase molybdenum cofactor assembly chaperone [Streptomyces sp. NBC_00083]MCX5386785.1 nitrate reductase molybdenum cofactor assembly chaperone [Streptomyces sp. NBC_00083]
MIRVLPAARAGRGPAVRPALHQAASLLLGYPDADWPGRLGLVRTTLEQLALPEAELMLGFCDSVASVTPLELGARYVATFDRSRRRALHLTYYTDGDTRRRGGSLARLKGLFRDHGWEQDDGELPDFLPGVLEFAARCPGPGLAVLVEHRAALELLGHALAKFRSPYADVVRAVCRTLPGPAPADHAAALRLARNGPPTETVGLAPFPPQGSRPTEGARR